MKLVRHYLKYDLLRWWWLLPVLWLSAVAYVWTMFRMAGVLSADFQNTWITLKSLSNQLHGICLLATVTAAALCYLAGAANSRLRGRAWTMTRPLNYRRLFAARALMLGAGVCLPLSLAQLGSLAVMEFSGTTILQKSLRAALFVVLAASTFWLLGMVGRNIGLILVVAVGATLCGPFIFLFWWSSPSYGARYHAGVFHNADVWPVAARAVEGQPKDMPVQRVRVDDPGEPRGMKVRSLRLHAFSWRASAADKWSPWVEVSSPARNVTYTGGLKPYAWDFELSPVIADLRAGLKNGDLRLGTELHLETERAEMIPIADYTPSNGEAWTMKAAGEQAGDGRFRAYAVMRYIPFRSAPVEDMDIMLQTPAGYTRADQNNIGRSGFSLPLMDLRFYTWDKISIKAQPSTATHFHMRRHPRQNPVFKVLELTGITLPAYQSVAAPPTPGLATAVEPRTWELETLSWMPQPLLQRRVPEIPEAGASRGEVAAYLAYLTTTEWEYRQGPWAWPESTQRKFAALVPQWLPVFLQAVVVVGERRSGLLERALLQGTPEERRAELIARIPESPGLARIAIQRGWLAEATPQFVALFQKAGGIPYQLEQFLTQFHDPVFHAWLRPKFRSTVPMIRFWQSVPELAKDLPELLAAARQRILFVPGDPNGRSDEINGLLSTGDSVALDVTLRSLYERHQYQTSWPDDLLCCWLRTADDRHLPYDSSPNVQGKPLTDFCKGLTAADFTWNAARGLFIQKSKSTQR